MSRVCWKYLISDITSYHRRCNGWPHTLNDQDQQHVHRFISVNRQATRHEITARINVGHRTDVLIKPVQQNLALMGYCSRRLTRVPLLTKWHPFSCTSGHINWTLGDWKAVAWSDESQFQWIRVNGRARVWCRPHNTMNPGCQQDTVQLDGCSIMVWAVFIWNGLGPLFQMIWSFSVNGYVQLIGGHLQPFMDFRYTNNNGIFMDDIVPSHRVTILCNWFDENSERLQQMI